MPGFDIESEFLAITLPEAKVAGAWALFDGLRRKDGSRAVEISKLQQARGHIEHFRSSNASWGFLTGPIDTLLRYPDENAAWVNFPSLELRTAFWGSLAVLFDIMDSGDRWRSAFNGSLIRLLTPEQRMTAKTDRISSRPPDDCFVWLSVDATLTTTGGFSWGSRVFRATASSDLPEFRPGCAKEFLIGECELIAATMAVTLREGFGGRNIVLRTDNQNVLSCVEHARSHSPVASRILRVIKRFCSGRHFDIMRVYVRSDRIVADGLTRWTDEDLNQWDLNEGATPVGGAARLRVVMGLSVRPASSEGEPSPNTFAIMGLAPHFLLAYNYQICEWRPINYAVASFLENWGPPAYSDQVLDA